MKSPSTRPPGTLRYRVLRWLGYALFLLALCEIGARSLWVFGHGMPFAMSRDDWHARYFPELRRSEIGTTTLDPNDGYVDVLLLGGSVLANLYVHQEARLRDTLSEAVGRPVRLYNLAAPAHTIRDSVLKYRLVGDRPVDLVILYHGINDTRMNNCSRERFRDDYTHASWYHELARLEAHAKLLPFLVFPFTVEHVVIQILNARWFEFYVRRNLPNEAMTRFGADIKTAEPFRTNLAEIVAETGRRGARLLVMTFDWYQPASYSSEAFEDRKLDYDRHTHPTEIWGKPAHVIAGMQAHNDVLREYARNAPAHVIYLDVEPVVPDGGAYWNDICHFNEAGAMLWLRAMAEAVRPRLPRKRPASASGAPAAVQAR